MEASITGSILENKCDDSIIVSDVWVGQTILHSPCTLQFPNFHNTEDARTEKRQSILTEDQDVRTEAVSQVLKVRFDVDHTEKDTLTLGFQENGKSVSILEYINEKSPKNSTKSSSSTFRDMFRAHSKRKNNSIREDLDRRNINSDEHVQLTAQMNTHIYADSLIDAIPLETFYEVNNSEHYSSDEKLLWSRFNFKHSNYCFQRSQSTKSRLKSLPEDDEVEGNDVAYSDSEGYFLNCNSSSFLMNPSPRATRGHWFHKQHYIMAGSDRFTRDIVKQNIDDRQKRVKTTEGNHSYNHPATINIKKYITDLFGEARGHKKAQSSQYAHSFNSTVTSSSQKLSRYILRD